MLRSSERITLYTPPLDSARNTRGWLLFVSIVAAALSLGSVPIAVQAIWWIAGLLLALIPWTMTRPSFEFTLDFAEGYYAIRRGEKPNLTIVTGPISDIAGIRITVVDKYVREDTFTYKTVIEFKERNPVQIDHTRCNERIGNTRWYDHRDWMRFALELAARLNVPLVDETGWRGDHPDAPNFDPITILPGETHPAFIPMKWKRW